MVLVAAITIGIIGIAGMRTLRDSALYIYENRMLGLEYVHEALTNFNQMRIEFRNVRINSFYDDQKGALDSRQAFEDRALQFTYWMEKSREIATTEELLTYHDRISDMFLNTYLPKARANNDRCINDIPDHRNRLFINVQRASIANDVAYIDDLLTSLVTLNTELANQSNIENASLVRIYITFQIILLLGAAVFVIIIAFFIIKSITVPIKESAKVLGEIAQGNFEARVKGNYKGDFSIIKKSVNYAAIQLSIFLNEKINAQKEAYKADLAKARIEAKSEAIFAGISYASQIQRNILPAKKAFDTAFLDYSIIWKPRDIVGGDIYWLKQFNKGTVLCMIDCTGHGTPGALLTMLVISALESIVKFNNCEDTANIIYQLDQRLLASLNVEADLHRNENDTDISDGCDLAVVFIAKNGNLRFSAGNTDVFICNGTDVVRHRGQKFFVGEGKINSKKEVNTIEIPVNPGNKFYIASDGLFDQPGGELSVPFGYKRFKEIILEYHGESQDIIASKVWDAFEAYRSNEPRVDDFNFVSFVPKINVTTQ